MKRRNLLKGLLMAPFMKPLLSEKPVKEVARRGLKYKVNNSLGLSPQRSQVGLTACSYTVKSWNESVEPFGVEIFKQKGDK